MKQDEVGESETRNALLASLRTALQDLDPSSTALLLSGGLDTAIIAGLASIATSGRFSFQHAITVSCSLDADTPHHDLTYAEAVARETGIVNHVVVRVTDPMRQVI